MLDSRSVRSTSDIGWGNALFFPQVRLYLFFIATGQKGLRCDAMRCVGARGQRDRPAAEPRAGRRERPGGSGGPRVPGGQSRVRLKRCAYTPLVDL